MKSQPVNREMRGHLFKFKELEISISKTNNNCSVRVEAPNYYRVVGVISQVDLFLSSSLLHDGHVTVQRETDGVEEVWIHDFMASLAST